ncbi:MAG TPA: replicative DNA helicase [Cyclobacteriaceae bacterium]|nr:replicative DNA helicase [Cyclobacteriaceae bacterium]HMV89555.1 replicative DNA helicase [Cyclobacteriaceae bacterium]HMX00450.1 replicative DNA helicase [Cyclobacteriaceae bacterium]HMX50466.1 replicative DNA helicase [Cyclobacteriaceae bacterium]HMY93270.1 replicative DNA helicase [Cyclobacteriaceae bacterium]
MPRDISESIGKLPPQALELEEAVLGALMLEKSALNAVVEFLKPEHFYSEAHREIYTAIITLFKSSEPVDMRTVVNQLRKDGKIELIGGAYYIAELTSKVSSAANIEYHARVIIEMAIKRDLIHIASQVHQDAYEDTTDVFELLDKTEQSIFAISDSNLRKNYDNMKNLMYRAIQELQKLKEHKDGLTGVPTGFSALDRMTSGWQNSDLVIIAARPGMGKTAFVVSAMRNAAVDFKRPVAIFSLEMASVQLVNRMISAEAELEGEKIRKGQLADFEWQQLVHKTNRLSAAPIFIDDTPALSILELRAKCRRLKSEHNVELIIVDYLQLMRGDSAGNREQEIASISRALKGIAKELSVPVLALSQLSRGVETRGGDKRPQLSDLRESGSIEQDADIVMFLYRPEYYKITVDEEGLPTQGMGEVIIAKHRNGSTGTVKLKFIGKYTKFADFDSPIVSDNPFSGMITRESRLNAANLDEPPTPSGDDTPF